jgi:DNA-binding LacI/PurR family transcriptional regulator
VDATSEKLSSPVRAADLADHLRDLIDSGQLEPGERLPTFAEMRRRYGAATNTVDRAYSQLETDGLIERKAGSGVYVAERPGTLTTECIGCLGAGFERANLYWNHCILGINAALESHGLHPLLLPRQPDESAWGKVDGLLCHDAGELPPECPPDLPRVSMLHRMKGTVSVVADDYGGGQMATEHLLELGHRRIASLIIHEDALGLVRLSGYEAALRREGITPAPEWSCDCSGDFDSYDFSEVARGIMRRWLKEEWAERGFTALVTQNDHVAIGAMQALEETGRRVPQDVSVVGFDGTELSEHCRPRLTTIGVPLERIGRRAAHELVRQIDDGRLNTEETIQLPVRLMQRDSTAPPPGPGRG